MVVLKDYQLDAIQRMHNGCILCGGTGSGKSLTSLGYVKKVYPTGTIYIITPAKKRNTGEWYDDIEKAGMDPNRFVIDSWNNLSKYKETKEAFFLFDEQKVSGKGVWAKSMIRIAKANQWILLSATPGDTYDDYATVLIANGFVKNRTTWYNDYCIVDPHAPYFKISGHRNTDVIDMMIKAVFVKMDYVSDRIRSERYIICDSNPTEELNILRNRKTDTMTLPFNTLGSALYYIRMNCYSKESKISHLKEIIKMHKKVIVFYNFLSEKFDIERAANDAEVPLYYYNGQRKDPLPTDDEWVYAVQYNSGAEAWNCITTDCIVFYSMNYSYKIMEQAKGRIDRVNSPFKKLRYYYLVTDLLIDRQIDKALTKKEDFNEKIIDNYFGGKWNV